MKKTGIALIGLALIAAPSWAGLRWGLGSAVAKRSANLIDRAVYESNPVGDRVAATLDHCPSSGPYDTVPTDLSGIAGIDPLGHVFPSGHTFPSDHIYFYASTTTVMTHSVYAPGNIHVTEVSASTYLSASPSYTDYSIYFYGCRELKSYFFHVRNLSSSLATQLGAIDQQCTSYSTGGTSISRCSKQANITMSSGDLIGTSPTTGAFDFGTFDYRITPLAFSSPSRHYPDQLYTVCPIDYFTAGPKASMEALLGRYDGGLRRTIAPICGEIMYDLAGTARGNWYHVGSPDSPEDPHLGLVPLNYAPTTLEISVGTSVSGQSAINYGFLPIGAGFVNRDFAQVTADGNVYCYDSFLDPIGQSVGPLAPSFILQLTSATTLRFERRAANTCGAGPWSFTSAATDFQR